MPTTVVLGKVVGDDAKINGYTAITINAENGVQMDRSGSEFTFSAPDRQPKTLTNPVVVDGTQQTTVEGALSALSQASGGNATTVIAYIEESPALAAHSVDDYIYYNGSVYKVKAAIEIGDTLVVDTNIEDPQLEEGTLITIPDAEGTGLVGSAVGYDNTSSGLQASSVQGAIDELAARGGGGGGDSSVTAHLETSPATAAHSEGDYLYYNGNIYEVIDDIAISDALVVDTNIELATLPEGTVVYIPETDGSFTVAAGAVGYDNTDSGLTATNVQDAIDEVNQKTDVKTTNPNLLDNPRFTVNSRGQSSYTTKNTYAFDRWYIQAGISTDPSVTKNVDGTVTIANGSGVNSPFYLTQFVEGTFGDGVTDYTASVIATAVTGTVVLYCGSGEGQIGIVVTNTGVTSITGKPTNTASPNVIGRLVVSPNSSITVKHIKVEKGTTCTIENDEPRPYAIELAKCQTSTADTADTYANQGQLMTSALQGELGAKNLNSYPYYHTTKSENGITFTDLGDGTIKVGADSAQTATSLAQYFLHTRFDTDSNTCIVKNGKYIISGCPNITGCRLIMSISTKSTKSYQEIGVDTGNGATIEIDGDYYSDDEAYIGFYITISQGTVIPSGGVVFKPMLRDARIQDDTYVPYAMTNRQLTEAFHNITAGTTDLTAGTSPLATGDVYIVYEA